MPRRSVAYLVRKGSRGGSGKFVVVYDFEGHIPTRFYRNLLELMEELGSVRRVQKSVYVVEGVEGAEALKRLVEHYGGKVEVFRVC